MEDHIKKILEDVYEADPSLKKEEEKLKKIIKTLIEVRPEAPFNKESRRKIKAEVLRHVEGKSHASFSSVMKGMFLIPSGIVVAAVIFVLFIGFGGDSGTGLNFYEQKVVSLAPGAFGAFDGGEALLQEKGAMIEMEVTEEDLSFVEPMAVGKGGGGATALMPSPRFVPQTDFDVVYGGESIELPSELPVFRRLKSGYAGESVLNALRGSDFGLIDFGEFSHVEMGAFSLKEEREKGYAVEIDLDIPSVSIHKNWEKWPNSMPSPESSSLDIPSDETLVRIAERFLEKYGVSREGYGQGKVPEMQKRILRGEPNHHPESIPVVYPLLLDGKEVYMEGGGKGLQIFGMNISVDIREGVVSSAWGIVPHQFESSLYEVESDFERIISEAKAQGKMQAFYPGRKNDVLLGTPHEGYMMVHKGERIGPMREFFVPALVFPIEDADENVFTQNLVIPVVRGLGERL